MVNSFENQFRRETDALTREIRNAVVERLRAMERKLTKAFKHYEELNRKAIAELKPRSADDKKA